MELKLKNFQSHKRTTLEFISPGVNVLWGLSMAGKSSIIRAMRKLFLYKPAGFPYIRDGEDTSTIKAFGVKLIHNKKGAVIEHGKTRYRKFGKALPEEITNTFRMGEVNFQFQHDKPFFFGNPASTAREINRITGQEDIDALIKNANREAKISKEHVVLLSSALKRIRRDKTHYKGIKRVRPLLIKAKRVFRTLAEIDDRRLFLENSKTGLEEYGKIKKHFKKALGKLEEKKGVIAELNRIIESRRNRVSLCEDLITTQTTIKRLKRKLNRKHKRLDKLMGDRCPLCNQRRK